MTDVSAAAVGSVAPPPSSLNASDWRGLSAAPPAPPPPRAPRNAGAEAAIRMFTRSRPADASREHDRARVIVAEAKGAVTGAFEEIRLGRRIATADLEPVVAAIAASVARSPSAMPTVTRLKQVREYTYLHSVAVCALMIALARALALDERLTFEVGLSGLLHDIGKARIPAALLDKQGPLDLDEYALVQQHTTRGYELLRQCGVASDIALDVCLHHHERTDGSGYPTGVSSEGLSVFARMAAVCDVYDAVTSARSYKAGWSPGAAIDWMSRTEGQFDPRVLRAFRRVIGSFPVGTLVMLESGRLAVVLSQDVADPVRPMVGTVLCSRTRRALPATTISTRDDGILSIEDPRRWGYARWEEESGGIVAGFQPS